MGRLRSDMLANQAWCRVQLGQTQAAFSDALAAEAGIDVAGQFDDRAMAHGRLRQVFAALGDLESAKRHENLASQAWAGHSALQAEILKALGEIEER